MFNREHTLGILVSLDVLQSKFRVKQTCLPFELNTLPGMAVNQLINPSIAFYHQLQTAVSV